MAVHRQPAAPGADPLGPRFRTLVPIEASVPDVDPGAALRRIDRAVDWRGEAWDWYESFSKVVADHIKRTYEDETRRRWAAYAKLDPAPQAADTKPHPGEVERFASWVASAEEKWGGVRRLLAEIEAIPVRPYWLERFATYARDYVDRKDSSPDRLMVVTEEGGLRRPRIVDTGTFFYEIPEGR